ncbi:MAG: hypothetical protein WCI75_08510, partial [candidate division NC10 bacterium]
MEAPTNGGALTLGVSTAGASGAAILFFSLPFFSGSLNVTGGCLVLSSGAATVFFGAASIGGGM